MSIWLHTLIGLAARTAGAAALAIIQARRAKAQPRPSAVLEAKTRVLVEQDRAAAAARRCC